MSEHPKLKWKREGTDLVTRDSQGRLLGYVFFGEAGFFVAYGPNGRRLGYQNTPDAAKEIVQAFADSETLRGRP